MDKKLILERLEMLVKLCGKTEPDTPGETYLFNEHLIRSQEMLKEVRDLHTGRTVSYTHQTLPTNREV